MDIGHLCKSFQETSATLCHCASTAIRKTCKLEAHGQVLTEGTSRGSASSSRVSSKAFTPQAAAARALWNWVKKLEQTKDAWNACYCAAVLYFGILQACPTSQKQLRFERSVWVRPRQLSKPPRRGEKDSGSI